MTGFLLGVSWGIVLYTMGYNPSKKEFWILSGLCAVTFIGGISVGVKL
jgi:hypothetical protein